MTLHYKLKELEEERDSRAQEIWEMEEVLRSLDTLNTDLKITVSIESYYHNGRKPLRFVVTDKTSWIPMFLPIQRCLKSIYTRRLSEAEQRLGEFRKETISKTLPGLVGKFIRSI